LHHSLNEDVYRKIMEKLCNEFQETVNLGIYNNGEVVIICKVEPDRRVRSNIEVGEREPLYATALGKQFLSEFTKDKVREYFETVQLKKLTENTIVDLDKMYEELKIVENVADLGKNVKKLETMVRKGPDNPKGIMSAKNYREKIVIPFIDKMYDAFKNVVKFAKGCFAQLKELTEKYNEQLEVNEMLRKQNSRLRESIDEQEKEIDGLYDDRKKLGYFKNFLRREDYNKVIEMGKDNEKTRHRQR